MSISFSQTECAESLDQLDSVAAVETETADALAFISDFRRKTGRPLRILHIGNIANNAYNNSCIQRKFGIEADVLCYNYYHIMGCPEWEDGAIEDGVSALGQDPFRPNWWATSLRGWRRQRWFVQGPYTRCIEYLRAKNAGWRAFAYLKWLELELTALQVAQSADILSCISKIVPGRLRFLLWLRTLVPSSDVRRPFDLYALWLGTAVANGVLGRRSEESRIERTWLDRVSAWVWLKMTRRGPRATGEDENALAQAREDVLRLRFDGIGSLAAICVNTLSWVVGFAMRRPFAVGERLLWKMVPLSRTGFVAHTILDADAQAREIQSLLDEMRKDPRDLDGQSLIDREQYILNQPRPFRDILLHYDIIQGYATDGIIPLINGVKNYACYEHGTLREIPFENNLIGLICRFSYQRAPAVFVTNSDVLPSVERLGLRKDRVCCLPHAFDDHKLLAFRKAHPELAPPKSGPVLFFSPTRHHWRLGNSSWQKGNDVAIRAAAEVARETRNFRLIFVEWGQEVVDSKNLIEELALSDLVEWIPTMPKRELWQRYCESHAVIDQFVVPALGGVGFEAMALGVRLISAINRDQTASFFGKEPPCLAAGSVAECAARMREVLADPLDHQGRGAKASRWMSTYHSAERIVALQCKSYRNLLVDQL
jgi:hypothetical protein